MATLEQITAEATKLPSDYAELVRLELRKRKLCAELEAISKEQTALATKVLRNWKRTHKKHESVGNATIYVREDWLCLPNANNEKIAQALEDCDLGHLTGVCYDEQEFRKYVMKCGEIPPELSDLFTLYKKSSICVRINK